MPKASGSKELPGLLRQGITTHLRWQGVGSSVQCRLLMVLSVLQPTNRSVNVGCIGGTIMIADAQPGGRRFDCHFKDRIRRQDHLEGAAITLAEAADALKWDLTAFHADIHATDLPRTARGQFIAERMGWPSAPVEDWCRLKLARACPIASRCARVTEPFSFSCDDRERAWFGGELTPANRQVLDLYGRIVTSGVAVPVHRGARTGFVTWCSRHRERTELASTHLGSIFFLSHVFIRHLEELQSVQTAATGAEHLTDRELECLNWAARGKSEGAIAVLLSRSRATVHFHLQNAVKKLDAGNRTHAVAIACARGLIRLA
jgi:DNA-binding CsgD family transcriptional regulator